MLRENEAEIRCRIDLTLDLLLNDGDNVSGRVAGPELRGDEMGKEIPFVHFSCTFSALLMIGWKLGDEAMKTRKR